MLLGDYSKAVAHCRDVLDILAQINVHEEDEKKQPNFRRFIDNELKNLPGFPADARGETLANMLKNLYGITSKAAHGSSIPFNRDDAEMAEMITLAILSYIGKFITRQEEV